MRLTQMFGSLAAAALVFAALTVTTESRAGGDADLVTVTCSGGALSVSGKTPWHTNDKAPWKWDKGDKVSLDKTSATFKGAKCEGSVTAFICNGDSCKGPIPIPVH